MQVIPISPERMTPTYWHGTGTHFWSRYSQIDGVRELRPYEVPARLSQDRQKGLQPVILETPPRVEE